MTFLLTVKTLISASLGALTGEMTNLSTLVTGASTLARLGGAQVLKETKKKEDCFFFFILT